MNYLSIARLLQTLIVGAVLLGPAPFLLAQEAAVIRTIGKEIIETLGKRAAEFGGEVVAEQTAKRLMTEAVEALGSSGGQLARAQIKRILATGKGALIFDLKAISGKSLPLLEDVADEALPLAVGTLARPYVAKGIGALGSAALQKAALTGEMRLPGAGLKLVEHYGTEGSRLATRLTEDQANSVIAALRPNAVKALRSGDRASLFNALTSRSDARIFNVDRMTGPLVVVASGIVIWHGMDLTLSPDERVTELRDGTVVRQKIGLGSQAVQIIPSAAHELSGSLKWTGIVFASGICVVLSLFLCFRQRRKS